MIRNMPKGFIHSVKVPRIYKVTANIVQKVQEDGASLKTLIYEKRHPNVSGIYALSVNTLQAGPQLDSLLRKTRILLDEPRLDPWLARVLITELLWGKKTLSSDAKPIQTILTYQNKLQEELQNISNIETPVLRPTIVQRPRYVRVNVLLLSIERAISLFEEEGWQLLRTNMTYSSYLESLKQLSEPFFIQDIHIPELLIFPSTTSFHDHAGYKSGELILQDKASCFPAHLLNPAIGSTVLDMCAAPGMKTTHLAAKLQNCGKIYAVEIDDNRFATLCNQVETTQSTCVETVNKDALSLDPQQYPNVEYILVDPSCSGSGIVGRPKQNDMDGRPEPKRLKSLQSFQVLLLRYALLNFSTVKKVVYSTCSVHPEENEEVIDEILKNCGDAYKLLPVKELMNDNWINYSSEKYNCSNKCLYAKSDIDLCNGFFVAVFERNFDVPLPEYKRKRNNTEDTQKAMLNIPTNNILEEVPRKRRKNDKKKNKAETTTYTQATKDAEDTTTSTVLEIENEKIDSRNNKEILYESENIESKKSRKKEKSKHKNIIQVKKDEKIIEMSNVLEKQQHNDIITDDATLDNIKPLKKKKKKKKKKKDSEMVVVPNILEQEKHKRHTTESGLLMDSISPKKKKKKRNETI